MSGNVAWWTARERLAPPGAASRRRLGAVSRGSGFHATEGRAESLAEPVPLVCQHQRAVLSVKPLLPALCEEAFRPVGV